MPRFMVERYVPRGCTAGVDDLELRAAPAGVRHIRTTYSPDDELWMSVFDAPSRDELVAAYEDADVEYERVVEVVELGPTA